MLKIYNLLDNPNDSSDAQIQGLMKEKALELPSRARLETAIYIGDATWAATELSNVKNEEGENTYTKVYTVLANNVGKSYEEIMQNSANVSLMQAIDKDSSDKRAYLVANTLLASVGLSDYQLYYQENTSTTDSSIVRKGSKDIGSLLSSSSLSSKPNPFNESTIIKATIAEKTQNAFVVVTDMLGKEISRYPLQQGDNEITFNASEVNQQVLFYSLIIDGVKIKTNKMILIK